MFYRSLFTGTLVVCALLSGETALAVDIYISNDDSPAYSLTNSLGQPLDKGMAMLGAFNSSTWSYDMENHKWNFGSDSYTQDQLKYSDLVAMQNNFNNTLTNIPEEQNGTISTGGSFNLSGQYSSTSSTSPAYLMVTGDTGELAIFVFKSTTDDSVLNYSDITSSMADSLELWLVNKASGSDYYAECILGNVNLERNSIQLLVPEPATATLSLLGLAALMMRRRRR